MACIRFITRSRNRQTSHCTTQGNYFRKKLAKLDVGDIISHEKRDKRIRTTIVLLGKTLIIINK